jgi:hypothetical protein
VPSLNTIQQRIGFFVDDEAKLTFLLSLHGVSIDDARAALKAGLDGSDPEKIRAWRERATQPPTPNSTTGETMADELRALRRRVEIMEAEPRTAQSTLGDTGTIRASTISGGLANATLEKLDDGASAFDLHAMLTGWRMHLDRIHPYIRDLAFEGAPVASKRFPIDGVSATIIDDQLKGVVLLAAGRHLDDPATSRYASCRTTKDLIDLLRTERGTFQEWDYTGTVDALHALDPAKYQGPTQFLRHGEDLLGRGSSS